MKTCIRRSLGILLLASSWLHAGSEKQSVLEVPWADRPPILDGKMDDACWEEAAKVEGFVLLPKGEPTQQTKARIVYDASNLYVFFRVYETRPGRILDVSREPGRDRLYRSEAVEIMLTPDLKQSKDWVMFIADSAGWRFDISGRSGQAYDPDWRVISGRFDGGWTVEVRIPFGELAHVGQLFGTPQAGDVWGVTFFRKQADPQEVSSGVPEASPQQQIRFLGQPGAPQIAASLPFSAWDGALKLLVTGASASLSGECRIFQDDNLVDTQKETLSKPDEKRIADARARASAVQESMAFPFRFTDGGEVRFKFDLTSEGHVIYSGQAITSLLSVTEISNEMVAEIARSQEALRQDSHPRFAELRKEVGEFEDRLRVATAEPQHFPDLLGDWKSLRRELNLARLYPNKGDLFAVGAATESEKIYPETLYGGSLGAPIRLALAGNEYGSFQLVVIPFWKDLKDVDVSFSELRGPDGQVITAKNIRWFRVGYVKLEEAPGFANVKYAQDHEPDPLLPAAPFDVEADKVAAVWVDVFVPEGTPAGLYTGTATITANGQQVTRVLEVRSHGFDIPERSSLEVCNWFMPDYGWGPFYGEVNYTPDIHAKNAEILGRYRVDSFPTDMYTLCEKVPITAEPDGRFTFDWTEFDKYVKIALKNHTTAFWSALSCNGGWTLYLNTPDTPVWDRKTGEQVSIKKYMQKTWNEMDENDYLSRAHGNAQFENPIYRDFLVAYVQHLKDLGINDISYYELFDEASQDPAPNARWNAMIKHHQFFRKLVPDLKLLDFGFEPTQVINGKSAIGLIDAWAPHLFDMNDPKIPAAIEERRKVCGEKFWSYSCTEKQDKEGNYTPFLLYHRPYISVRMNYWMAWKYQWDGFLLFSNNLIPKANTGKSSTERWPNTEWTDGGEMGCGLLVYPGPNFELIPSMRLANARDGLQDYEYFALLRREVLKLDAEKHKDLRERVEKALRIEPQIISSVYVWTKDAQLIRAKRAVLAGLIEEVRRALPSPDAVPQAAQER
jgi:hypothetical protein